jgi:hypothetical protein
MMETILLGDAVKQFRAEGQRLLALGDNDGLQELFVRLTAAAQMNPPQDGEGKPRMTPAEVEAVMRESLRALFLSYSQNVKRGKFDDIF